MYLKKIIMQGFKSFADKTELDFYDGITAIVGPNGSGKSNILDALRWVMGEMSAKTLRGANMQQIIFAGTQTRKPLNFAEVSLVLDNSDRSFDLDYDEIIVTRRVFRSGESVYMINNSNCRLKDVQELFMDTGIGKGGYSLIGQGNIAQILSTKAEDRRSFFESAAGISKYKYRKDEAERKLEQTTENLIRITDITRELETQATTLESQSKKAKKYLEYYAKMKALDVSMSLLHIKKNDVLLKEANASLETAGFEMEDLRQKESEIIGKVEELYEKIKKLDDEKNEENARLASNEEDKQNAIKDVSIAQNNIENNENMVKRIDKEIQTYLHRVEQMKSQIEDKKESIRNNEDILREFEEKFSKISQESNESLKELNEKKEELERIQKDFIDYQADVSQKKATIDSMEKLRGEYLSRYESIKADNESLFADIENINQKIKESEESYQTTFKKSEEMEERVALQKEKVVNITQELDQTNKTIQELLVKYNSKISKKRILESMENDYEGYFKSVKDVLKSQELKKYSIFGTLSGLIRVEDKYVTCIEMALGAALQNIIVESEDDAKAAIAYLKENKSGRATFLPVTTVKPKRLENEKDILNNKGCIAIASDLVTADKKFSGVVENLLGRTVVCENIDDAIKLCKNYSYKFKVVTLGGEIFNPGGSISGGSVNKSSAFLSRANEIKTLGEEIILLAKQNKELEKQKEMLEGQQTSLEKQLDTYTKLWREYESQALVFKNTTEHLKNSILSSDENSKSLAKEITTLEEKIKDQAEEIASLIAGMSKSVRCMEEAKKEEERAREELKELEEKKQQSQETLMKETLNVKDITNEIKVQEEAISSIEANIEAIKEENILKQEEKQRLKQDNISQRESIDEINEKIQEFDKNSQMIRALIEEIDKEKDEKQKEQRFIQESNKDITDRLMILQKEYSKQENKVEKLKQDQDNIIEHIWDEYELTPGTAEEIKIEIENEKQAEKELSSLKRSIKDLGSVNIDAVEEYKTVKERYDFLSAQKIDLEKSSDNLSKIIKSLQDLMKEHFDKQFDEINKSFKKTFNELFDGGNARLYLQEPDNILESGIEIEAQLPGKALQNMSLYSGGEKAMIATALLFAILNVKPTPFCVLDEIDAALDDVNVSRFATYLKNYFEGTQFIVITHRRGTMEAANVLYGVTMQEKGVTKMLSLEIDEVSDDMVS